ncbi:MAG: PIN domain nuclease, partial [Dehalococcoidia bacterium]|nr:PIN domain nuclease [Dehalococcoidia bacterium]
ALTLAGLPVGALVAPYLTIKPWRRCAEYISSIPGSTLVSGTIGLLVGLVIASLISIPLY